VVRIPGRTGHHKTDAVRTTATRPTLHRSTSSALRGAEFAAECRVQRAARTVGTSRHNIEAHDIVNVEGFKIAACRRSAHCFYFDHALSDSDGGAIWIITDDLEDADAATTILWPSD
jgi:hypothetical protein